MSRQYFADLLAEPPLANLTAVTATTETGLWAPASYSPIAANDARPGKVYRLSAGGVLTFAATGVLTLTPRFGLTVSGVTMGASAALTVPGILTNQPWRLEMDIVVRSVGAPGANSTITGTGHLVSNALGVANSSVALSFGGTVATADVSVATGIFIGWTLSVAGSVTPHYVVFQSLN